MSLILVHLGDSQPEYLIDCIKQVRLWSKTIPIYLIIEHPYWLHTSKALNNLDVHTVLASSVQKSPQHLRFLEKYSGDTAFRAGYWKQVQERFFYIHDFMLQMNLTDVLYSEYDVLWYYDISKILTTLKGSTQCLRFVKSEPGRAHPAVMYIPSVYHITTFTEFLLTYKSWDDMKALDEYAKVQPVAYLPVMPFKRSESHYYLYVNQKWFGFVFDSLVVGQYLGGIDPRNTNGANTVGHKNTEAVYNFDDLNFSWKVVDGLWQPQVQHAPLVCIHMHSKATRCFMSDRTISPRADYDPQKLLASLPQNLSEPTA